MAITLLDETTPTDCTAVANLPEDIRGLTVIVNQLITIVNNYFVANNFYLPAGECIVFEGTTDDDNELTVCGGDPTTDRVQNFADATGTILCTPLPINVDGNEKVITKTNASIRTITASDDVVAADGNKIIACNHATVAIVVNLDATNLASGNIGFTATVMQQGAAGVSFTTTGSIISEDSKVALYGQGTGVLVVHLGSDVWWIAGRLV